eukprot:8616766-Pyramimonas_sp.AAC.1
MKGCSVGLNYHVTTAILRKADRITKPDDEDVDDEPKEQPPLLLGSSDTPVPKLTTKQVPFLRAYLQGGTITGHRLHYITKNPAHKKC